MTKITPVELRAVEFKKVMRGLDPEEVKIYIKQSADTLEELILENKRLLDRMKEYERLESIIKEAAIQSQQTLKTQEENARKEAILIIEKAKLEAEKIIEDANKEVENIRKELFSLKSERDKFVIQFKGILNYLLIMLEGEEFLSPPKEVKPSGVRPQQSNLSKGQKELEPITENKGSTVETLSSSRKITDSQKSKTIGEPPAVESL